MFRRIVLGCVVLTLGLVMLGAYVRLSDAGLGCPDWPGCYGKLTPLHASSDIAQAIEAQGGEHGPVSMPKAWKEMVHRYLASSLGLVIFGLMIAAWRKAGDRHPKLATVLFAVVCLQGAFGAWTVTLLLKPAIVTGHLIGGMLVLGMLTWFAAVLAPTPAVAGRQSAAAPAGLRLLAAVGLTALALQIALGGWVSTNYAALACPDFPTCRGSWVPDVSFEHAFHILRELGRTTEGDFLPMDALVAIHWTHRVGALVVAALLATLAWRLVRGGWQTFGWLLAGALLLQLTLGVSTVLGGLPLPLAVAHNGGAALLVICMTTLNVQLARGRGPVTAGQRSSLRFAT